MIIFFSRNFRKVEHQGPGARELPLCAKIIQRGKMTKSKVQRSQVANEQFEQSKLNRSQVTNGQFEDITVLTGGKWSNFWGSQQSHNYCLTVH